MAPKDLRNVVDYIESTSPTSNPRKFAGEEEVLAYHINAYNVLAMYGVIEEGIPQGFNSFLARWVFQVSQSNYRQSEDVAV